VITTIIFDLDGLLADTEKLHRQAYQKTLAGMGVALTDSEYEETWIRQGKGISDYMTQHGLAADPDALRSRKAELYNELVSACAEFMPGAGEALSRFAGRKTLALATASYRDAALAVLTKLGIRHMFACIATQAEARRTKPWPDIFIHVAAALSVRPAECLVVEDSEKGVVAAAAAGMRSVAVPNIHTRHHDFSRATVVLQSLHDLTPRLVEELGAAHPPPRRDSTGHGRGRAASGPLLHGGG
jgi:HAD superfamily hydrolase (TIGR01509 family)